MMCGSRLIRFAWYKTRYERRRCLFTDRRGRHSIRASQTKPKLRSVYKVVKSNSRGTPSTLTVHTETFWLESGFDRHLSSTGRLSFHSLAIAGAGSFSASAPPKVSLVVAKPCTLTEQCLSWRVLDVVYRRGDTESSGPLAIHAEY